MGRDSCLQRRHARPKKLVGELALGLKKRRGGVTMTQRTMVIVTQ